MKKKFEKAELEIVEINNNDVVMTDSGNGVHDVINGVDDNFFNSKS